MGDKKTRKKTPKRRRINKTEKKWNGVKHGVERYGRLNTKVKREKRTKAGVIREIREAYQGTC